MAKKKGARSASNADDEERQLQIEHTVEAGQQEQQEPVVRDVDLMTQEELRYAFNVICHCSVCSWSPAMRAGLPIG